MPFLSTPDNTVASITDIGRINFTRVANGEISFNVKYFAVGRGGYQMADPVKVVPIDPSSGVLIDQFFPASPPLKPIEKIEYPTDTTVVVYCRLAAMESIAGLGEIGMWAEIIYSINPVEVGTQFLLAVAHTPLITKTNNQVSLYRFVIQF